MRVARVSGSRLSGWLCRAVGLSCGSRPVACRAAWGRGAASGVVGMGWWLLGVSAGMVRAESSASEREALLGARRAQRCCLGVNGGRVVLPWVDTDVVSAPGSSSGS